MTNTGTRGEASRIWVKGFEGLYANKIVAVTPDEAAKSLVDWTGKLDISKSGEYWAPRGPRE